MEHQNETKQNQPKKLLIVLKQEEDFTQTNTSFSFSPVKMNPKYK